MTVFRQENLEEHYETGEDLGRWVRAGTTSRGASGRPGVAPGEPGRRLLAAGPPRPVPALNRKKAPPPKKNNNNL